MMAEQETNPTGSVAPPAAREARPCLDRSVADEEGHERATDSRLRQLHQRRLSADPTVLRCDEVGVRVSAHARRGPRSGALC